MLRTSSVFKILSLCLLAQLSLAQAQQTPSSAPPKLDRVEEGSDTPITIAPKAQRGPAKVTENKQNGQVTEVTVQSGKSTYTLKPNNPPGNAQPGDAEGGSRIRGPQWKVLEFDIGKQKQKEHAEEAAAATPPPPPPPATPVK